ncbi:TerD family protein [Cellulomonas gilvus]|uniref:TerD family protein n=1 Tax=Cellulomonas gilvus TaxID=11 RepID=UPI0002FF2EEA|nr:TerD family protein [Cellulomonas gilvus]
MIWPAARRSASVSSPAHKWAVVDVETSGLSARSHRVLSVAAAALDERGNVEDSFESLLDPGCDPGPVHIHGLTRERLAGSPQFAEVSSRLNRILSGRVLVAHNAAFDHGFLQAESIRAGLDDPVTHRLCTVALSRRIGVPVPNHRLDTLASYWRIPRGQAHVAADDVRVLVDVFRRSRELADRLAMPLPVVATADLGVIRPDPPAWSKRRCDWSWPGRLAPGAPLVQGMKVVITGDTRRPRETLCQMAEDAGLEIMSSVSKFTSVVVCNRAAGFESSKLVRAADLGTHVIDEATLLRLLPQVLPGAPRTASTATPRTAPPRPTAAPAASQPQLPPAAPSSATAPAARERRPAPGRYAQRRVLVLGGPHDHAADIRALVVAGGGAAAVNLSLNVTDLVALLGAEQDRRVEKARAAGVRVHLGGGVPAAELLARLLAQEDAAAAPVASGDEALELPRGGVVDLPAASEWTVRASWRVDEAPGADVDVVALLLDQDGRVSTDEDFVFYNQPSSDRDAVRLVVDGPHEQSVAIDLDQLPDHCDRIVVAAAVGGGPTFGDVGAIELNVDHPDGSFVTATLDAATSERTLVLTELYLRAGTWRVRVVGQGYDHGLAELAASHGVAVDDR